MEDILKILSTVAPYIPTAIVLAICALIAQNKNARIDTLKERLDARDDTIKKLTSQTADALTDALESRIRKLTAELGRLRDDESTNRDQICRLETEREKIASKLNELTDLLNYSDLLCSGCGAPLSTKAYFPAYGHHNGREIDYDIEHIEYECGRIIHDGRETHPCPKNKTSVK